ncbi:hypothetical protein [Rhizobium herbae]|uniref:DUF2190 family protein n=1 Tax=Rhizobium herbae TaxID=508661 RepID=A0ABS4EFY9_9HYPH|nr:hypothetical protein [Rhizobium herbae]MBP1856855.1 hypothetical protein [Rhizobium herbae]
MRKDSYSNVAVVASLVPAVQAATLKGSIVDLKGFSTALLIVNTGAIVGAGDYVMTMQHSDTTTDGDFVDVPATDRIGTLPATLEASTVYRQAYIGKRRYTRAVVTKTGGTSIAVGAVFVKGTPHLAPVA